MSVKGIGVVSALAGDVVELMVEDGRCLVWECRQLSNVRHRCCLTSITFFVKAIAMTCDVPPSQCPSSLPYGYDTHSKST